MGEQLKFPQNQKSEPPIRKQILSQVALEMRTPLSAILGYAEMMYDAHQPVSERLQCIGRIRQNINDLTEMIDNLVDFSRVESEVISAKTVSFSLLPYLGQILSCLKAQAWKKRISFHTFFETGIPDTIETDPNRLKQILLNVIGNIVRVAERGGVTVITKMKSKEDKDFLTFVIRDSSPTFNDFDFDLNLENKNFLEEDKPLTKRQGGVGLSLVVARRLARSLKGDLISQKTEDGTGSEFIISIDPGSLANVRRLPEVTPDDLNFSEIPVVPESAQLSGMRLLLVEDAPDIQLLIRHFLTKNGVTVDVAENGVEALKKAKQND